jgi:acetyl esterase/lipase
MLLALVLALLVFCASAQAAALPCTSGVCEGPIESFDDTKLDATVTMPPSPKPRPLVVFLHGLLADKTEYLSDDVEGASSYKTVHWNNRWFAQRGYAVANYSARGHGASEGQIELASREVEVRDVRTVISRVVDAGGVDPKRVVVLGSSYGGGQTWLLMTTRAERGLPFGEWRTPGGKRVRLAAIVPQYTWTDLVQSLVPNGRASSAGGPLGVAKVTLIDGFLASAGGRLPSYAYGWLARTSAGEPYEGDPQVAEARRALSEDRSAFFQDAYFAALRSRRQRAVPVFAAQGLTDPIFSAQETVRMYDRLRDARRRYPIKLWLGDFEHLTALVKIPELQAMHDAGTRFIGWAVGKRRKRPAFDVTAAVTNCDPERFGPLLRARTWRALGPETVAFDLPGSQPTASPLADPRTAGLDPVAVSLQRGRGCLTSDAAPPPGVASWDVAVPRPFTLAGAPRLRFRLDTLARDVTLAFRLWDGPTLVTRGAWRALGPQTVDTELWGATWHFGDRLRLEIAQVDAPFLRPDNFASASTVSGVRLELPSKFDSR